MKALHVMMAVVGGAMAGAAVGLLYAPKKGRHTRRDIYRFMRHHGLNPHNCAVYEAVKDIANVEKSN